MKYTPSLLALISLLSMPVEVAAAQYGGSDTRMGTFVGARFRVSLGREAASSQRAELAVAPTMSRVSGGAIVRTNIGEGIALKFGDKPTLTLAGVPADQALGLVPSKGVDTKQKLNLSTGGWIAVGVGGLAIGVGLVYLKLLDIAEHDED